jgi:two-component system cell cycle response regulator DivK
MPKQLILYVEDDELSREVMDMVLEDEPNYEVVIFADSANFEERLRGLPQVPILILLDIHVQPISGFDMLDILRGSEAYRKVRTVALTASVMNEEVARLRQSGFDGAISKPIDQDRFVEHIEQLIAGEEIWSIISHIE